MRKFLCLALLLLSAAVAAGAGPAGWFDNVQLEVTMTRDAQLKGIFVNEPDAVMKNRTYHVYVGLLPNGVTTGSRGSNAHTKPGNWYYVPLTKPVWLRKGQRYTIQTRYYADFFNAGKPQTLRFAHGDRSGFKTYDGISYYGTIK